MVEHLTLEREALGSILVIYRQPLKESPSCTENATFGVDAGPTVGVHVSAAVHSTTLLGQAWLSRIVLDDHIHCSELVLISHCHLATNRLLFH